VSEDPSDNLIHTLRESGARYVIGTAGHPVAVLLTLEEYEHYLDLLDDEAYSQDAELAARLAQAAVRPTRKERQSLRDYLHQRELPSSSRVRTP
jgi:PHD/YefM family antitoxin component YafN of YafNO toxin-antitoxin module